LLVVELPALLSVLIVEIQPKPACLLAQGVAAAPHQFSLVPALVEESQVLLLVLRQCLQ
jgi:hypothetical protein